MLCLGLCTDEIEKGFFLDYFEMKAKRTKDEDLCQKLLEYMASETNMQFLK